MALKVNGGSSAYLVNRYLAYRESWLVDKRDNSIPEKRGYVIQWKNIRLDLKNLIKNPVKIAPAIGYSLASFYFLFKGLDHDFVKSVAFGGAVAIDPNWANTNWSENGSGVTLTFASHDVSGSNRIMFVGQTWGAEGGAGVTFNGDALTLVVTKEDVLGLKVWRLIAPDTGVHNVIASLNGSSSQAAAEISFTGADQTQTGVDTSVGSSASASGATFNIDTTADNSMVLDFIIKGNNAVYNEEQGTEAFDFACLTSRRMGAHYALKATQGAQVMSWNWTGATSYDHAGIEILEGSGGGGGGPANLKTWNGVPTANIKTINGVPIASVKNINGVT